MLVEVGEVTESLSTLATLKGLFSGVDSPVLRKGRAVTEGLSALTALVGLLPSVDLEMLREG